MREPAPSDHPPARVARAVRFRARPAALVVVVCAVMAAAWWFGGAGRAAPQGQPDASPSTTGSQRTPAGAGSHDHPIEAGSHNPRGAAAAPLAPREFVRILRVTGLTEATRSHVVTVPLQTGGTRESLVITRLAPAGRQVKAGDIIAEFDAQNQEKAAFDKAAEYKDLQEQIVKKRAEHDAARVKDESEREQAANRVQHVELEVLKNEMLARIKAEQNLQDLDEARKRLAALRESFDLKRRAARAELRVLEIKRDRARAAMEHAERNAKALTIRAPFDGLVVPRMMWKGAGPADVQEGDQLWSGAPVLEVVNPASMQVRGRINQADMRHVGVGQRVTVRLDAYPDLALPGRIAQVAPLALPGSFSNRVRTFAALVVIDGASDRLLPDLTAAIDIELERIRDALVVPRHAVHVDGDRARVRVRSGESVAARDVTLGPGDDVDVVVTGGLRAGEVVLQ